MTHSLLDGKGKGNLAQVDAQNRLHVQSVTVTAGAQAAIDGDGFNHNTGNITFTDGAEYGAAYITYTGTKELVIEAIAVGIGDLGGTVSDPALITLCANPTGGTLISSQTDADMIENRNFGNANIYPGVSYKGTQGSTVTGGSDVAQFYQNGNGRMFATINFILEQGNSMALKVKLNATNGGNFYTAFICHEEEVL